MHMIFPYMRFYDLYLQFGTDIPHDLPQAYRNIAFHSLKKEDLLDKDRLLPKTGGGCFPASSQGRKNRGNQAYRFTPL